jgi:hypothetical protein
MVVARVILRVPVMSKALSGLAIILIVAMVVACSSSVDSELVHGTYAASYPFAKLSR